jgi:hypothetical protein
MLVSTRAATFVEVLSSPTPSARPHGRTRLLTYRRTPAVAFGRLVEQTELRFSIFGRHSLAWRNDANHFAGGYPVDLITGADAVPFRDLLGHSDLVFRCDLAHTYIPAHASHPYHSKDKILVQPFIADYGW